MNALHVNIGDIIKCARIIPRKFQIKEKKVFESCFVVEVYDGPLMKEEYQSFKVRYFSDGYERWFTTEDYGVKWEYI